jgi:hypothetical protein
MEHEIKMYKNLTSNSFEGHPWCMHADYLPTLCWYPPSYHAYWEWIIFKKTGLKYPNSKREYTEFWVMLTNGQLLSTG